MTNTHVSPELHAKLRAAAAAYKAEKSAADSVLADEQAAGKSADSINFSVRLPVQLAAQMRATAGEQNLPTSVWLRKVIMAALREPQVSTVTDQHIEDVVRRVLAETPPRAT